MFKNLTIYKIHSGWAPSLQQVEDALNHMRFSPCGPTQQKSYGWVEPRGEDHAPLVEAVAGQWVLKMMIETRSVPGAAVKDKAQEAADQIEQSTGRKPGRKEMASLREEALLTLLPQAFPRKGACWVWIDLENGWLVTDAASKSTNDEVITALVRCLDGLKLSQLDTRISPAAAMTQWLLAESHDDIPGAFCVERECELKSAAEDGASVKFNRHNLATEEVKKHITQGKLPVRLGMSWDGRIGFLLSESMAIKKVDFLEGVFSDRTGYEEGGFDADVALTTGELRKMLPALIEALGGELDIGDYAQEAEAAYGEMAAA